MVAVFLPQLQRLIYGNITVICLVIITGYIVQRSNSCNIVGTSIQITLSNYSCLNTTTITMTCATYNSDALVWIVGQDVKSFLLRAANAIQYFNSTYSGVNCTAYRRLVNVTNQIIESEIICKIIGGLSYPLHFVCKSNDDNADYCSSLLETIHCYDDMIGVHYVANKGQENQTSVNSIQIKAIVIPGAVVGAGAIVIFICVGLFTLYLSLRRKNARKVPQNATECSEGTHDTQSETIGLPSTQPKRQAVTHKTRGGQSGDPQCLPMRTLIDGFSEQNTLSAQDEKSNGPVTDNTVEESVKCLVEEALPASNPHKMDSADGKMESGTAQSISVTALQHESESAQNASVTALQHESESAQNASVTALQHTRYSTSQNTMNEAFLTPLHKPASSQSNKVDNDPTGQPTISDPTGQPTTSDPTVQPTTSDPTGQPTTSDPTGQPTTSDPTGQPTISVEMKSSGLLSTHAEYVHQLGNNPKPVNSSTAYMYLETDNTDTFSIIPTSVMCVNQKSQCVCSEANFNAPVPLGPCGSD